MGAMDVVLLKLVLFAAVVVGIIVLQGMVWRWILPGC